jgi:hypothetical protein
VTTAHKILAGTAVIQAVLMFVTWRPSGSAVTPPHDLLPFPIDAVTKITIEGRRARDEKPPPAITLEKKGEGWVLTSSWGYPAGDIYVKPLLEALSHFQVQDPIANQASSHAGLDVSPEQFTRRVELTAGDGTTKTVFVGAGQGKVSHVRLGDEDAVYDAKMSAWSIADAANRYFERELFKVDPKSVKTATLERAGQPPVVFQRDPADPELWTVTGFGDGLPLVQQEVNTFVAALLQLRMLEPAGDAAAPEHGFDTPSAVVSWTAENEGGTVESHTYKVGAPIAGEDKRHWLTVEGSPYVFRTNDSWVAAPLSKPLDKLIDTPVVDVQP